MKKTAFYIISLSTLLIMYQNCSFTNLDDAAEPSAPINAESTRPNVLFIIADDLGVGEIPGYNTGGTKPNLPNISNLVTTGVSFDNVWAYPICSPTRASVLTGKNSLRTGVTDATTNNVLDPSETTIFDYMKNINSTYQTSVFGKWHVSGSDTNGPAGLGVDNYKGLLTGSASDYYSWNFTDNGSTSVYGGYITEKISDMTIDWINSQGVQPWFAWVAYTSPHTPFHLPPANTHSQTGLSGTAADIAANPQQYFFAMVENLDYEIGRVLSSLSPEVRANTTVIFLGDNGTHKNVIQAPYPSAYSSKGTLYQGGIHVPLVISGAKVNRVNTRESALISSADIHPTILELMGASPSNNIDGISFVDSLTSDSPKRTYLVSQVTNTNLAKSGMTIRNNQFKYFIFDNSNEKFFDLNADPYELSPLNTLSLTSVQQNNFDNLKNKLTELASYGSSKDLTNVILTNKNGNCKSHAGEFSSSVLDVNESTNFNGQLTVTTTASTCIFTTNSMPNHDFNDGTYSFNNVAAIVSKVFEVTQSPTFASTPTPLAINADNAIFLNGAKLDMLAAACYGVGPDPLGSEKIGCGTVPTPWRYDPLSSLNNFRTDTHNAHTQANGSYHYHGNPNALFTDNSSVESPVIGFAADGFPIYGSYINDNGTIRRVLSGYTLKNGARVSQAGEGAFPGGSYDGSFRDDYEHTGAGDLDECNGMTRDGQYGYYITNSFPWTMACFKGTPHSSFNK